MKEYCYILKRIIPTLLAVTLLLFGCGKNNYSSKTSNDKEKWILKESNGYVFVYRNNEQIEKTKIVISSLPRSEAMKLKEGIEAQNIEEVERIIELYES